MQRIKQVIQELEIYGKMVLTDFLLYKLIMEVLEVDSFNNSKKFFRFNSTSRLDNGLFETNVNDANTIDISSKNFLIEYCIRVIEEPTTSMNYNTMIGMNNYKSEEDYGTHGSLCIKDNQWTFLLER